jgi:geranylgeranyl diphosphate synthase type II
MSTSISFDQKLCEHVSALLPSGSKLRDAVEYALRSPGKRLRPTFVIESGKKAQLDARSTELLSYAIELVHIFSLVHDDLPCMDNDDFRRGLPTTHKIYGDDQALLVGDLLLSLAFQTFNQILVSHTGVLPKNYAIAFDFFVKQVGGVGMIAGQSLELEMKDPSIEVLLKIQDFKTGALFRAAILTPLLLVGIAESSPQFLEFQNYANAFGFAFQIADDLEDRHQDAGGVKNILSHFGEAEARKMALRRLEATPLSNVFSVTEVLKAKIEQASVKNQS